MIRSMTSYGRSSAQYENKNIVVEIRSLNSKYLDLRLKAPANLQERELDVRKQISTALMRGKIDANISYESTKGGELYHINQDLFKGYYDRLKEVADSLDLESKDWVANILRIPEVISATPSTLSEKEWSMIEETISNALVNMNTHRVEEGKVIWADFVERIAMIKNSLNKIEPFEGERIQKIREKFANNFKELAPKESLDENRLEQEIFFYLEKIDFNEEKIRLSQHCKYFLEVMESEKKMVGKKLTFISQEMGREINTLGAKAYSSEIQRLVVGMKDELERIKEQLANVL